MTSQDSPLKLTFGVLLIPFHQALDVVGPVDVINSHSLMYLNEVPSLESFKAKAPIIEWHYISTTDALDPVITSSGPPQTPTVTYKTCPPLDYLIVPGPADTTVKLSEASIEFIQKQYIELKGLILICTGSLVIAQTGVLNGLSICSAKSNLAFLANKGILNKSVKWVGDRRWAVDGKVWSSGAVTAGIDLACEWARVNLDHDFVEAVKDVLEYTPLPDQPDVFARMLEGVNLK